MIIFNFGLFKGDLLNRITCVIEDGKDFVIFDKHFVSELLSSSISFESRLSYKSHRITILSILEILEVDSHLVRLFIYMYMDYVKLSSVYQLSPNLDSTTMHVTWSFINFYGFKFDISHHLVANILHLFVKVVKVDHVFILRTVLW